MTSYWSLPGFEDLYLEDSWILAIESAESSLNLVVEFVLRESHPKYRAPREGEMYCYQRGRIRFEKVSALSWTGRKTVPAVDAGGEPDLGGFDEFEVAGNDFVLSGDFGRIELRASRPVAELLECGFCRGTTNVSGDRP